MNNTNKQDTLIKKGSYAEYIFNQVFNGHLTEVDIHVLQEIELACRELIKAVSENIVITSYDNLHIGMIQGLRESDSL